MVLRGSKVKTSGGLKKENLRKNKAGKIVSKAASDRAKKAYVGSPIHKWTLAVQQAKKELKMKGMVFVGGKTPILGLKKRLALSVLLSKMHASSRRYPFQLGLYEQLSAGFARRWSPEKPCLTQCLHAPAAF